MSAVREVAVVWLANRSGEILLQHRTDDAPIDPSLWTLPGGAVEPPETPLHSAHRELLEEAGLRASLEPHRVLDGGAWGRGSVTYHVFTGTTDASDEDIVLGEGQAMCFLAGDRIRGIGLTMISRTLLFNGE